MDISYEHDSKKVPVYRGNIIKPNEVDEFNVLFCNIFTVILYQ